MGFEFALDELYATGWSPLDSAGCSYHTDGRSFPTIDRIRHEFAAAGCSLKLSRVDRFNCCRAEWSDASGAATGSVVGHNEAEAAVFAFAQLRRQLVSATA